MRKRAILQLLFGCVLFACAGCSLFLDWEREGLPCDDRRRCEDGFSCRVETCVSDHSLRLGETCSQPVQCETGLVCGSAPSTCREECDDENLFKGGCGEGQYCRPEVERYDDSVWLGTCIDSECGRDTDCGYDRICVPITAAAGSCLLSCEYNFGTGHYTDNCGSQPNALKYCQPIGKVGGQKLVCLENITGPPVQESLACSPVTLPCDKGLVCHDGVCRRYCGDDIHCSSPQFCQAVPDGSSVLYSYCSN